MTSSGNSAEEKRRFARYHIDIRLRAFIRSGGQTRALHGRGGDLSTGGMAAFLPTDLTVGESIELEVTLPYSAQPLRMQAVVRNRRGYQYGIEFAKLTPAQAAVLERVCASLKLIQ